MCRRLTAWLVLFLIGVVFSTSAASAEYSKQAVINKAKSLAQKKEMPPEKIRWLINAIQASYDDPWFKTLIKKQPVRGVFVYSSGEGGFVVKYMKGDGLGGRVIAVGTTAVRSLETACQASGELQPFRGDTDIFIYPGYSFHSVDAMVTNFHLPESTLLMLVSAFAGREPIMAAYAAAIESGYRFFSYGDAMFITANPAMQEPS